VAASLAAARPDEVVYLRQANRGLSGARNAGIDFALAAWPSCPAFYFLDADNRLLPDFLERAFARLAASTPEVGWVYPDIDMFGFAQNYDTSGDFRPLLLLYQNFCEAGSMVRRDLLERGGVRFDEGMRLGFEDWDFWIQSAAAGFEGRHLPKAGFMYRRRAESMLVESERYRVAIQVYMRRKHDRLLRPRALLAREHAELPLYAWCRGRDRLRPRPARRRLAARRPRRAARGLRRGRPGRPAGDAARVAPGRGRPPGRVDLRPAALRRDAARDGRGVAGRPRPPAARGGAGPVGLPSRRDDDAGVPRRRRARLPGPRPRGEADLDLLARHLGARRHGRPAPAQHRGRVQLPLGRRGLRPDRRRHPGERGRGLWPGLGRTPSSPGPTSASHFPGWIAPAEGVAPLPVPCLWHQRPVRAQPDGSALGITRQPRLVAEGMLPSLPHAAWLVGSEGRRPLYLALAAPVGRTRGRVWGPRTHLALLAGTEIHAKPARGETTGELRYTVERPVTLDTAGPVLRLYGFGTARGKAEVCHLTLSGEGAVGLRRRPLAKAAAVAVAAWLDAVEGAIGGAGAAAGAAPLVEAHGGLDAAARVVDLCGLPRDGWVGEVLRPWAQGVFDGALAAALAPLRGLARAEARLRCEARLGGGAVPAGGGG
jgi:GT2 family glycosyltransferase